MTPMPTDMPVIDLTADEADAADWSRGGVGVVFQQCQGCDRLWYFRRGFCPGCGRRDPATRRSAGIGRVHATTLVQRAPTDAFRAIAPYRIVLVDLAEGFRIMAHGDRSLAIGDAVRVGVRTIAGRPLPYFMKDSQDA